MAGRPGVGSVLTRTDELRLRQRPTRLSPGDWQVVVRRVWREAGEDDLLMLSAGVAFWSFLAVFPGIAAALLVYGLVTDAREVGAQLVEFGAVVPTEARDLVAGELEKVAASSERALGFGLLVSVALALWSASTGIAGMMKAVDLTYDAEHHRPFVARRGLAVLLTLGAIGFVAFALVLLAALPVVLEMTPDLWDSEPWLRATRWLVLFTCFALAVGVLYRVAPGVRPRRLGWVSVGSIAAAMLWLLASFGFSAYVDRFASYGHTYGSASGVVVLLVWLFATALAVLVGAELNAEVQRRLAERRGDRDEPAPRA